MRKCFAIALVFAPLAAQARGADPTPTPLPVPAEDWSIELVAQAPEILFPTAIVAAPDGTVYLGSDPMDMPGPPPHRSIASWRSRRARPRCSPTSSGASWGWNGSTSTLYVVHAPFLSAFRDTDGDGKADERVDLITGLGPKLPGFNGLNDHIAAGIRLGMDGFLYIAVGDKGIPHAAWAGTAGRSGSSAEE